MGGGGKETFQSEGKCSASDCLQQGVCAHLWVCMDSHAESVCKPFLAAGVSLGFREYLPRKTCMTLVSVSSLPQHTVAIRFISIHLQSIVSGSGTEITAMNKKDPVLVLRGPTV